MTKSKKMGRPKSVIGKLVTCSFELTVGQKRYVVRRAKSCGVSTGELIRTLINSAIAAEQIMLDAEKSILPSPPNAM